MKLSTQGRHAIMSMLALAARNDESALRLHDIAEQQAISLPYMEQIFRKLRLAGLVEGQRGPHGGYRLSKMPRHITVAEVIRAVEDSVPVSLPLHAGTDAVPFAQQMWEDLSAKMYAFLDGLTLASLISEHQQPRKPLRLDGTAGLIASMFPPHASKSRTSQPVGVAP